MKKCVRFVLAALALCLALPLAVLAAEEPTPSIELVAPVQKTEDSGAPEAPPSETAAPSEPTSPPEVMAQAVIVNVEETVLFPGQRAQASAQVSPADAEQAVAWSSSAPGTIAVDEQGQLIADSGLLPPDEGVYVDIWARATDGSLTMNCTTVHVMPAATMVRFLSDDLSVHLSDASRRTYVAVALTPSALYGVCPIEWSSSNEAIVSVSPAGLNGEMGLLTWFDQPGQVVITARAADGSACADALDVSVLE